MKMSKAIKKYGFLYLMFLPVLIYFLIFSYYPLFKGFIISLQDFRIIGNRPFVGLENYKKLFGDVFFKRAVVNTLIIGGGILVIGFFTPIIVALQLNEVTKATFKKFTQTIIYMPHLFSWVVVGGIWIYMLSPDGGLVNEFLKFFGNTTPIHFMASEKYARPLMIFIAIWKSTGYSCILYLAAIVGINPSLYESARLDGANRWQEIIYITLPQLKPTMKVVFILNVMGTLRIFDQIFAMINPAIANKINVVMMYTYEKGILQFKMGIASAAAIVLLIATLIITMFTRKLINYDEE